MNPFGVCRHCQSPPPLQTTQKATTATTIVVINTNHHHHHCHRINCYTTNNSTNNNTTNDGHSQTDAQDKTDINNRVKYGGVHRHRRRHRHNHNHICSIYSIYCFIMQDSTHSCIFSRPFSFHSAFYSILTNAAVLEYKLQSPPHKNAHHAWCSKTRIITLHRRRKTERIMKVPHRAFDWK